MSRSLAVMHGRLLSLGLLLAPLVPLPAARAECADAGSVASGTCIPQVFVIPQSGLLTIPPLNLDAIIADDGSIVPPVGGTIPDAGVFLTVRGPGSAGGGILEFADGGYDPTHDTPLVTQLGLIIVQPTDGGSPTLSLWGGSSPAFLGLNTVTVTVQEPSGVSVTSEPSGVWLVNTSACQAGGSAPDGGCAIVLTVELGPIPATTRIPILDVNALITDNGSILGNTLTHPGTVSVTVYGPGTAGGGTLVLVDGGTLSTTSPFVAPLSLIDHAGFFDAGTPIYSLWGGLTSLFEGANTIIASATEYGGTPVTGPARTIFLVFSSSTDGGTDGGTGTDAGIGNDAGTGNGADAGGGADSGTSGGSGGSGNCSGTPGDGGGTPSFVLMALLVIFLGVSRRSSRG